MKGPLDKGNILAAKISLIQPCMVDVMLSALVYET